MFQITPKGVAAGAQILYELGYLRDKTRSRIVWLYQSGVGWENREFRTLWRKVNAAARRATGKGIIDAKN